MGKAAGMDHLQVEPPERFDEPQVLTPALKGELTRLRKRAEEAMRLDEKIEIMEKQIASMQRVLARVDAQALAKMIPPEVTEYDESLCTKLVALAFTGMPLPECIIEMGVSRDRAMEWKKDHPEWANALSRARDLAVFKYFKDVRLAINGRDKTFPLQSVDKFLRKIEEGLGDRNEIGDASELVRLDGTLAS